MPVENVLGEIGKGHKIAFNVLNVGRFKLGAAVTGAAKLAFRTGAAYANARKQFGVPIARGAIQEKLADLTAGLFASESIIYRLAGLIDDRLATIPKDAPGYYEAVQQGIEEYAIECAVAKVFCSEVLADVVDEVVQIHGGYGFIQEYPAEVLPRRAHQPDLRGDERDQPAARAGHDPAPRAEGDLPLEREAMKAMEALMTPSVDELDPALPFAAERAVLGGLKKTFLVVAGAAVQRYREALKDEQETRALADVAIQVFAIESALLRAEISPPRRVEAGRRRGRGEGPHLLGGREDRDRRAPRRVLRRGDTLTALLGGVRRFTVRRRRPARGEAASRRRRARGRALSVLAARADRRDPRHAPQAARHREAGRRPRVEDQADAGRDRHRHRRGELQDEPVRRDRRRGGAAPKEAHGGEVASRASAATSRD